ncbi:MAG: M15 family metallopeptidase [Tissierellaceae bacterium]
MDNKRFLYLIGIIFILLFTNACGPESDGLSDDNFGDTVAIYSEDVSTSEETLGEETFTYGPLPEGIIHKITGLSYLENDNVSLDDLAYVQITHWGFDEDKHIGELIVNSQVASDIVEIFRELYDAGFQIEKMRLIDEYGADDDLSMMDNNSSAFCYREVAGSKGKLSKHSLGLAIDINPVQNPYIKNDVILPAIGGEYLDRENYRRGMIIEGDSCYEAFISKGWTWGGNWKTLKDYQHFEFDLP